MSEMCAQRSKEAAEKVVRQGESTARMKWTPVEIDKFKAALAKFGPDSNMKISAAIGTRTRDQVNVYKWRFLRANPSWLGENYHPDGPAANSRHSSPAQSPPSSQATGDNSPATSTTQQPTAKDIRARPANQRGTAGRPRRATATSTSPPSATSPSALSVASADTPPPRLGSPKGSTVVRRWRRQSSQHHRP